MMSVDPEALESRLEVARQKKVTGDAAFKSGNLTDALRAYYEVILYAEGLEKSGSGLTSVMGAGPAQSGPVDGAAAQKERTEGDELVEKAYANMSACHIKRENWKRAQETAEKALAKNPKNFKAMFRRGKALGEQGFFERAEDILEELIKESPADAPAASAELKRLRAIDKEREKMHSQKLRGWLTRGALETSPAADVVEEISSPGTKETRSAGS
ncbi:TPR-like protein [Russula earlei]|uniref:TPR-like protein n=1 Tax=Russula earlei TaxID=71964 RepID=A0ACC0U096_9AGAM|nr:TPR-like protein [Russula earlei]